MLSNHRRIAAGLACGRDLEESYNSRKKKEKDPERRGREGIRERDDSLWKSKIKWWGNVRGAMSAQLLL